MSNLQVKEYQNFEEIKKVRQDGSEYWNVRELSKVLQYKKWENFSKVVYRAKLACQNSGFEITEHFPEVRKTIKMPKNAQKEVVDYLLEAAHNAGVITNQEYVEFQNAGYMGLYGGLTVEDIHKRKKLKDNEKILDFMGSTELISNLFRISQTEEKLKKDKIETSGKATATHYEVGSKVRKAIEDIGGTMPEDLPTPKKSIKQIEKEQLKRLKDKKTKLMLDE